VSIAKLGVLREAKAGRREHRAQGELTQALGWWFLVQLFQRSRRDVRVDLRREMSRVAEQELPPRAGRSVVEQVRRKAWRSVCGEEAFPGNGRARRAS